MQIKFAFKIALQSANNRKFSVILSVIILATSTLLFLGVDKIQKAAFTSFSHSISDTDLIVGARSSSINLLLYTVFRIGSPTQNISWNSYQKWKINPEVEWAIPISLGDSHKGFRVIGTNENYFKYFKFGYKQSLAFESGLPFNNTFEAVIGNEVARTLSYELGDSITITHGIADLPGMEHEGYYFIIKGIIEPTGTPVDRSIHIPLEGIEAIHSSQEDTSYVTTSITSFLLGLKSRMSIFRVKRNIELDKSEALSAVLPGAALQQLWQTVKMVDSALKITTFFMLLIGLSSILGMLWTALDFRRREMMIFRAIGAKTRHIFALLYLETFFIMALGFTIGYSLLHLLLKFAQNILISNFGLKIQAEWFSTFDIYTLMGTLLSGLLIATLLTIKLHKNSLQDGLVVKL